MDLHNIDIRWDVVGFCRKFRKQILIAIGLITVGLVIGILIKQYLWIGQDISIRYFPMNIGKYQKGFPVEDYSCNGITVGSVSRSGFGDNSAVSSSHSRATDELAISIDKERASIFIITATAVGAGVSQPDEMVLVSDDGETAVAIGAHGTSSHSIFSINRKTGLAFWVKQTTGFLDYAMAESLSCN